MPLVVVGVLLLLLKVTEIGPFGSWSWWWVLSPFAVAAVWWQVADSTGYTQRKAIEKMEKRKTDRRDRALTALQRPSRFQNSQQGRQLDSGRTEGPNGRSAAADDAPSRRDPTV